MEEAKKHSSKIIDSILNEVTPLEMVQAEVKLRLSARIQELIDIKGWNKIQFASKINKNPSEITRWLSGTHNFTLDTLIEISNIFDIDISTLMDFKREEVVYRTNWMYSFTPPHSVINKEPHSTNAILYFGSGSVFQENLQKKNLEPNENLWSKDYPYYRGKKRTNDPLHGNKIHF